AESELARFLENADVKMFLLQAEDRFGSSGNSGLIIFRKAGAVVEVDTFLMSCRIIGRLLDRALFCESLRRLRAVWSFGELRASYVPTQKNGLVSRLWQEYGFSEVSSDGGARYACRVAELKAAFPEIIELAEHL